METNFISQSFKATLNTLTGNTADYLDILGRFQQVESIVQGLEADYEKLNFNLTKAFYRQNRENKSLNDVLNGLTLEKMWIEYPLLQKGLLQTVPITSRRKRRLDWDEVKVYPMNLDLEVVNKQINTEVIKPTMVVSHLGKDTPYCKVNLKLPAYTTGSSFIVDKNYTEIHNVKICHNGEWQELSLDTSGMDVKESKFYIDKMFNEIEIIFKTKKIGNDYFFSANLECFKITKKSIIQSAKIQLNSLANSVFLSSVENILYFDGYLTMDRKRYQVQIPMKELSLSRLEKTNYSAMSGHTVFKCPFPVDTTKAVSLYKSLNTAETLSAWQWKIEGEDTWKNPDSLWGYEYSGIETFSNTPRYFYVKIQGYADSLFLSYTTKKNINCSWPLSDDGVLQYNGIGILLKNPNTADLRLVGGFYGLGNVELKQGMLIGILGVD